MIMALNKLFNDQAEDLRNSILNKHNNLDMTITRLLLFLGLKPHLFGTVYLRVAIKYCCTITGNIAKINFGNEVYPFVANICKTIPRRVERDIRTAIQCCYNNGGMEQLNAIVGYEFISSKYPPTNSEFIMGIASWLRLELADLIEETVKVERAE